MVLDHRAWPGQIVARTAHDTGTEPMKQSLILYLPGLTLLLAGVPGAEAQTESPMAQARRHLAACLVESSIRKAAPGEPSFTYQDPNATRFMVAASTPTNVVATGFGVAGPRLLVEGDVSDDLYTVIICDDDGIREALRTLLRRGLGLEIRDTVREMPVLVMAVGERGRGPDLATGSSTGGPAVALRRDSLIVRNAPLSRVLGTIETLAGKPVVDESGIDTPVSFRIRVDRQDPGTIMTAFAERLGLVLREARREIPVLVVGPVSP